MNQTIVDSLQFFYLPKRENFDTEDDWLSALEDWSMLPTEIQKAISQSNGTYLLKDRHVYEDLEELESTPTLIFFQKILLDQGINKVFSAHDIVASVTHALQVIPDLELPPKRDDVFSTIESDLFFYTDAEKFCFDNFFGRMMLNLFFCNNLLSFFNFQSFYAKSSGRCKLAFTITDSVYEHIVGAHTVDISVVAKIKEDARDPLSMWLSSTGEADALSALLLESKNRLETLGQNLNFSVRFSDRFYASLLENQCTNKSRFSNVSFEKIVQAICQDPRLRVADFRENKKSKAKHRTFGDFSAKRAHIVEGKIGLRLMFWQSNSEIILDNISPKWDLELSNPVSNV